MFDKDEIIEMARQAGFEDSRSWTLISMPWLCESLEVFAKLVDAKATAKEREACAKLCIDEVWASTVNGTPVEAFNYASRECANRIRARGGA